MFFNHTALIAEIESSLMSAATEAGGKRRVIEKPREDRGKVFRVAGAEHKACLAKHFGEGPQVRGHHWQTSRHSFSDDQTEHFSTKRRNDDYRGSCQRGIELRFVKTTGKLNLRSQLRIARELFESAAVRAVTDDQQFKRTILPAQDFRGFD